MSRESVTEEQEFLSSEEEYYWDNHQESPSFELTVTSQEFVQHLLQIEYLDLAFHKRKRSETRADLLSAEDLSWTWPHTPRRLSSFNHSQILQRCMEY